MKIAFTKISHTHHRLVCERADGTVEETVLETKSFLVHDFVHLVYEEHLKREHSFWGLVAAGAGFVELRDIVHVDSDPDTVELTQTEMIVGPLQRFVQGNDPPQRSYDGVRQLFEALGASLPDGFEPHTMDTLRTKYRALWGAWKSTEPGDALTVLW